MEFKDYYQTLGVEKTATLDNIKKAYRKLARKFHPDVSKEPNAEEQMKTVNEAYAVLSDVENRAAYDQVGNSYQAGQEFRPPPNWNEGYEYSGAENPDASDFFEQLFGRKQQAKHQKVHARGEDQHTKIVIELSDAYHGVNRELILRNPYMDAAGHVELQERRLNVQIPKGVKEGQHIRLAGQGRSGFNGGPAGDLYLEIHFSPNPIYQIDGRDVYEKIPVTPWEAAIGGSIAVPTPTGTVEVTIPPESQSGRKLRLKGRGIPAATPGDLYLVLEVVLPVPKTDREKEIYQTMAREMAFNPRREVEI